ncbi:agmatine deiminase family protein [Kribbella sandramycini]|uniref:Agmatine deiminase n=1 Tax=Kribbella sandramycini TaxID=60450 RepID=A0A7Y4KZ31_9ACTN|nr:agmatine deiminase family protein [Kribbella sandramycini]MBB6569884.1 agmatine deiminase [Kribbella sandramycini]NOL40291.1 agmatine deiminase family protein [Kribbella sandramycini]
MTDSSTEHSGWSRRQFVVRTGLAATGLAVAGGGLRAVTTRGAAMAAPPFAVPGEEAAVKRTWMAWPSSTSIWGNLLSGVQGDVAKIANEIVKYNPVVLCADGTSNAATARGRVSSAVTVIGSIPVNDCWMRDTGPLFRLNPAGQLDAFGLNFNGWGNEQTHAKDNLVAQHIAAYNGVPFNRSTVVGEGGGVLCDGDGTLIANRSSWLDSARNPGKSLAQIEAELLAQYGATKMIWCQGVANQDITDDHIDSKVLFVRPGVVIVQLSNPARPSSVWSRDAIATRDLLLAATDAKGRRLQVITIYGPATLPRIPSSQWPAFFDGYLNCAMTNSAIITAQFGDAQADSAAKAALESAFGRPVVQLNLDRLMGDGGGGAHCVTMNEPVSMGGPTPTPTPTPTGPRVVADRTTVRRGGQITATVTNGPGNTRDWVGLYRASATNSAGGVDEKYLNGRNSPPSSGLTSASITFTAPNTTGTYNFRFFANDGYPLLATSATFSVT